MKKQLQAVIAAILVVGSLSLHAQTGTAAPAKKTTKTKQAKSETATKTEESQDAKAIRELQEKMAAQQAQIDALMQQNAAKDAALSSAQNAAASAQSQAAAASAQAQSASSSAQASTDAVTAVKSDVTDLKNANAGLATTINDAKKDLNDKIDSPSAIHYKGVTISPGRLLRGRRPCSARSDRGRHQHATSTTSAGHPARSNAPIQRAGRQSRIALKAEGKLDNVTMSGYFEIDLAELRNDFQQQPEQQLHAAPAADLGTADITSGFAITGGQMWSLAAEDHEGH